MTPSRAATLARLAQEEFDVLVIGAGATGAAIARDAALRGLRVALCDRSDYAGETSSYSSKLIHGGLRYLEHGDLRLVYEALADRNRLLRAAPHLCRPIDFLVPGYRGQKPAHWLIGVGVHLYNALALGRPPSRAESWRKAEVEARAPQLRTEGLLGGHVYVDCQTDDARLVLETVQDATLAGAACANYVAVIGLDRSRSGHVRGARLRDRDSGATFTLAAPTVVNATGPFVDALADALAETLNAPPRLRPTLGVHIVVDGARLPTLGRAYLLRTPQDGRAFFILPSGTRTLIGTTDTDWVAPGPERRSPHGGDFIQARTADVAYLLAAANHACPLARLGWDDVISTFAGLRPLLRQDAEQSGTPSATSREHAVWVDPHGVLTIAGGKLTTMRTMGEQAVDRLIELLRARGFDRAIGPCLTRTRALPREESTAAKAALVADEPSLGVPLSPGSTVTRATVLVALRSESAVEIEDVLRRRTGVFREATDQGLDAAPWVADQMAHHFSWDPARRARSLAAYAATVQATREWRKGAQ